MAVTAR